MQVVLLDKIPELGILGDQVKVKDGYARNYLIPKGKAVLATKENIKRFEDLRAEIENKLNTVLFSAKKRAEKINSLCSISIKSKVGNGGKLFGSIGARDIAAAITAAGVKISKNEVRLPKGALRNIGKHEINLQLHSEVFVKLAVDIIAE